jgi:solute carrier family 29 (equilibrative nucleoside transporter), member 1/2/3
MLPEDKELNSTKFINPHEMLTTRMTKGEGEGDDKSQGKPLGDLLLQQQQQSNETEEEPAPKDHFRLVYLTFYLMGIGTLFPWNVFITANDYFAARFTGSPFGENFQNYFGICYMLAFVVVLLTTLRFQQRWNIDFRVVIPLIFIFLIFLLSTIFVKVSSLSGASFFYCNMVFIVMCGMTASFFQPGIIGFASQMPGIYVQSVMTGQALAGVAVAAAGFFTSLGGSRSAHIQITTTDTSTSTMIYFIVAVVVIVACLLGYVFIRRHPLTVYYVNKAKARREEDIQSTPSFDKDYDRASVIRADARPSIRTVLRSIWDLGIGAFLVFCVTLSAFPSIVVKVASVSKEVNLFTTVLFVPVGFLVFNLGDFIGRSLAGIPWFTRLPKIWLHVLTLTRIIFIPIFMISNIQSATTLVHTPHLIMNDAAFFIFYTLFGFSNGYLGTLYMIKAPSTVLDDAKELVGLVMVLCVISGLTAGSFFSFFLRWIICRCNPFA